MSIGVGIFLLVLGAILAFAVHVDLGWLNLTAVGWILVLAGLAELAITLAVWRRRRRMSTVSQREVYRDGTPVTVTERQTVDDAPPADPGPGGSTPAPPPARHSHHA